MGVTRNWYLVEEWRRIARWFQNQGGMYGGVGDAITAEIADRPSTEYFGIAVPEWIAVEIRTAAAAVRAGRMFVPDLDPGTVLGEAERIIQRAQQR